MEVHAITASRDKETWMDLDVEEDIMHLFFSVKTRASRSAFR